MKYKRISASVLFDGPIFNEDGVVKLSQTMRDKVYGKEEGFREKLILEINKLAQKKWHIHFNENPSGNFDADVFIENDEDYTTILSILEREFRDNPLEYICKKTFRNELFKIK